VALNYHYPTHEARADAAALKSHLKSYDLAECVALCFLNGEPLPRDVAEGCLGLETAAEAVLLLDLEYSEPEIVGRFRRSALVDIDPGLLHMWVSQRA